MTVLPDHPTARPGGAAPPEPGDRCRRPSPVPRRPCQVAAGSHRRDAVTRAGRCGRSRGRPKVCAIRGPEGSAMTQVQGRSGRRAGGGPAVGEPRPTREQRVAWGRAARSEVPRSHHAEFAPGPHRPDPLGQLENQGATRVPELLPIRYRRMAVSPFTFFRGAAVIMASDLANTPGSGITVQACGDAHLSNFGLFASPERPSSSTSTTSTKPFTGRCGTGLGHPPAHAVQRRD
jgi:hypothetical protein